MGIVCCLNANIGLAPWDLFYLAVSKKIGLTIGMTSSLGSLIIVVFNFLMKEKLGLATILHATLMGPFIDLIIKLNFIPKASSIPLGVFLLLLGLLIIAIGTIVYLSAQLGAGPGEGLMLIFVHKTGKDLSIVRNTIEFIVALTGILLGGSFGLGTILTITLIGPLVKAMAILFKVPIHELQHQVLPYPFAREPFQR